MAENTTSSTARKSAARAKPARGAATSVRSGRNLSSRVTSANASKREKAAANLAQSAGRNKNQVESEISELTRYILKNEYPRYTPLHRVWLFLLGLGLVLIVITALLSQGVVADAAGSNLVGYALVAAYVVVIGAFIYDIVLIRPMRNEADAKARSIPEKRRLEMLAEIYTGKR